MSFLREAARRKVPQVAAIYAVTAWVLVQIVATVEDPLNLPDWVDTLVIVLLGVGFPIAIIMSWAFNLTSEGLVRDPGGQSQAEDVSNPRADAKAVEPLPNSIAVLPLANLSPNPDDAFFAAGMHEQLLNELAKIADLNVIARTSVLQYESNPPPVPEIATALNVKCVMEGSVRYAGDKVRVTAQLIDGISGAHLWTETYDGDLSDIFAIQTDIATTIAQSLHAKLLPETRKRLEKVPTKSTTAYTLYLEARAAGQRWDAAASLAHAERALELDPDFALAWAHMASLLTWHLINGYEAAPVAPEELQELERRAITAADRALQIDPACGPAWTARGQLNRLKFNWASAANDFARAFELAPNDPTLLTEYAMFKAETGDHDGGMALAQRLVELSPGSLSEYSSLMMVSSVCREFGESMRAALKLYEVAPTSSASASFVGHAFISQGDFEATERWYGTAEELLTDQTMLFAPAMIYGYGLIGQPDKAQRLFERLQTWLESNTIGAGGWMYVYLGLREADKAYEWLQNAVKVVESGEPDPGFMALVIVRHNVHDDPILEEPRFQKLFRHIEKIARSR